jgi:Na+/H+ antiporter NhaD/arsenite permease-like protein
VALAIGRIQGFRIDRAGIALVGAALTVASGVLSLEEAYRAVGLDTLTLLLGMVIVVANPRLSGALMPLVVADIMRGTGRYNLGLGAIATMHGLGASTSGLVAGVIVDHFGCSAAFLIFGAAAFVAFITFAAGVAETRQR